MVGTAISLLVSSILLFSNLKTPLVSSSAQLTSAQTELESLALGGIDLSQRHPNAQINEGFKENILLNLDFLNQAGNGKIVLQPGEVFAFHKNILPEFNENTVVTQESEYRPKEGYKLVAGLYGNGVCHLASLMNWVASEAGLAVTAQVNHNFAPVPGIDKKYGTSIKFYPNIGGTSERQNLYIRNNQDLPVLFSFKLEGNWLWFSILKLTLNPTVS